MERFNPCETEACKKRCDTYGVECEDICIDEIERLKEIESAALNLCKVKGRHNSEIAMKRLMKACGFSL